MFYCLNIAPHETTYVPEKPSFKTKCCTHAHFACWCCHRPLAEVKIHTDNAGTAKWVQLDLQSIQHRDYFGHLSICHFKMICSLFFAVFPDSQKFSNSNKSCCFGYCIDLLRQLAQQCNFTYSLHLSFNEYGSLERNNQTGKQEWNGLIGKIKALERLLGWI